MNMLGETPQEAFHWFDSFIGTIIGVLLTVGGLVFMGGKAASKLEQHEKRLNEIEKTSKESNGTLARLETKLDMIRGSKED